MPSSSALSFAGQHNSFELRQAVEQPVLSRGVRFEPGLVERLLSDVGSDPGNLPLLQFCLTQWGPPAGRHADPRRL